MYLYNVCVYVCNLHMLIYNVCKYIHMNLVYDVFKLRAFSPQAN